MVFVCLLMFEVLHTSNTCVYTLYYEVYILLFLTSRNLQGSLNCQLTPALVYLNVVKLLLAPKHLILGMACLFSSPCFCYIIIKAEVNSLTASFIVTQRSTLG